MLPQVNLREVISVVESVIVGCSIAHTFLPPWDAEAIAQFPALQKWYRLLIYVIGYIALNARSTVYPSISTQNPNSPNANIKTLNGGTH